MNKNNLKTNLLVEASVMIALATVLSLVKFADMPYGGSITLASMLPIVVISYRQGIPRGLAAGLVYGVLQQLLGLNTLSYFTTWQSVVAVVFIDYIGAFAVLGLGGAFGFLLPRGDRRSQRTALALGMLAVCILRYTLHVIAGATVWAGLSIPTEAALVYSISYNATYMIPEAFINTVVAAYVGGIIDFSKKTPLPFTAREEHSGVGAYRAVGVLALIVGAAVSISEIFTHLQNEESGAFDISGLSEVGWVAIGVVTLASLLIFVIMEILRKKRL